MILNLFIALGVRVNGESAWIWIALLTRKLLNPTTYSVLIVTCATHEAVDGIVKERVTVMLDPNGRPWIL
jgi:hypothetical protein